MYTNSRPKSYVMPRFNADSAELDLRTTGKGGSTSATSDALLQGSHGERLHDGPGGLRLHRLHLAEDLLLARLRGRLVAGLDHAQAWEGELAVGLDLLRGKIGERGDDLARHGLLELELLRDGLRDSAPH